MESDVRNSLEYWVSVALSHRATLYDLRRWAHLKIANDDDGFIWIRGFTSTEIESVRVLSIPSAKKYYLKNTRLYLLGHRLPYAVEPTLLWTDIQRGLSLSLPSQNFNYFGIDQSHSISIIPSDTVLKINVTLIDLEALYVFVKSAAKIRMSNLFWTIVDNTHAMVVGNPLLPIKGEDYYKFGCFIIPGGWKLKYEIMLPTYEKSLLDSSTSWYLINERNEMKKIRKSEFTELNKGSVVQSMSLLDQLTNI